MTLFWTVADWLFKGEVFLSPKEIQTANGSFVVRPSENRIDRYPHAALESQRIGGIPARGDKGADNVFFRTDKRNIERIAGDSGGGMGKGRAIAQIGMLSFMTLPEPRGEEIGSEKVDDCERKNVTQPLDVFHNFVFHRFSRAGGGDGWCAPRCPRERPDRSVVAKHPKKEIIVACRKDCLRSS